MTSVRLPILRLAVPHQVYSCHGCGNCCRDFTVQLRADDIAKLHEQNWDAELGEPVTIEFRGRTYLRQREDGSCIFLMDDGLCRIHAEHGFSEKPVACQLFPFHLTPTHKGVQMGLNFACQSVLENKGAALTSHQEELQRMLRAIPEAAGKAQPPLLTDHLRSEQREIDALTKHVDGWLARGDVPLMRRLEGLAWVASSLGQAKMGQVRGSRFGELLDVLFAALPDELDHYEVPPPSGRQMKMLRRAVFARVEDPKLTGMQRVGRWRTALAQLGRQRRFAKGRGEAPPIGADWPESVMLEDVPRIAPASDAPSIEAVDDLMTRYLRASVLGGRAWGGGYYGWSMVRGLQNLVLNAATISWLARLHAAGRGEPMIDLEAVRAAIGRVDRTAGRAAWLGTGAERLRLRYFEQDHGLWRLIRAWPLSAVID